MHAALAWLCVTFGVSVGSALLPIISVEVFVVGMVSSQPELPWLGIAAVVAVGQIIGKLPYFLAARGYIHLPDFLHRRAPRIRPPSERRERWKVRTKRIRGWILALRERCHQHPHWMAGTYGISSVLGLPPFMAMTVLAGLARMSMSLFVGAGLLGRFARFSALAASPGLFAGWLHL